MYPKTACVWLLPALLLVTARPAHCEKDINGVKVLTTLGEYVDPRHTAVIVVDMQNEIASTEGGYWRKDRNAAANPKAHRVTASYRDLAQNIRKFLEQARAQKIPVIYAEYIHRDENGKMVVNGTECWTHRNSAWVSCAVAGTWEAKTIDELAPQKGDPVIRKSRANAFYNTYLDDILKEKGIQTLLLTGTAGGGCVFATAMGAMDRGYYAVFVKDCVDQRQYLDSDLIRGRFPIYSSKEVQTVWRGSAGGQPVPKPQGKSGRVQEDAGYKK